MSKQKQGRAYRANTLTFLARVGYASTRQVAMAVWGRCTPSTRKMAARTLRALLASDYIVTKRDGESVNGEQLAAVTASGAAWLAEAGEPLPQGKAHARDWLRHSHSHRTACNSVYAASGGLFPETCAWSELEIRAGWAPISKLAYSFRNASGHDEHVNKIPDVLLELEDGRFAWVEVENAWRSDNDLAKVLASMRAMTADKRIAEVHFVITAPGAKTIGTRLRRALTHGPDSAFLRQRKELDARILADYVRVFSLDEETLDLVPVAF